MKNENLVSVLNFFGSFYWIYSLASAIVSGGFWWIVLNVFIPIEPMVQLYHYIHS